jgi:hypothetical protein
MAKLGQNFDATAVDPVGVYQPIPADEYMVQIINSSMKPTKDNAGEYLELEMDILEGDYAGRKLFERLNLKNANQQTVEIALRTLSGVCRAAGVMNLEDSDQLHFKPLVVKVEVKPAGRNEKTGRNYDTSNVIKGWRSPQGEYPTGGSSRQQTTQQQKPVQAAQHATAAPAARPTVAPWRRGK